MNPAKENRDRAARCLKALRRYNTDSNPRTCFIDFLADAMHLCRLKGHDFHGLVERASEHFTAEVFDEPNAELTANQRKESQL
jgi:hypothetical protein